MKLATAFVSLTVVLVSLPVAAAPAQGGGGPQGQPAKRRANLRRPVDDRGRTQRTPRSAPPLGRRA